MMIKLLKLFFVVSLAFIITGCSNSKGIEFCEGTDTEGKGVTCGKEFTTGDLSGVITWGQPFETDTITVKISRQEKNKNRLEKTMNVAVVREKKRASFDLSFYNAGVYTVEAYRDNNKIGEGTVSITDTY